MNTAAVIFLCIAGILLLVLPRRLAVVPLLLTAAYTTRVPVLELGPASFSILRVLVIVGFLRVVVRRERVANGLNAVDWIMLAWAVVLVGMSAFHTSDAWTYRAGLVWGELGVYVLCRVFIHDYKEVRGLFKLLCLAVIPLATLMLLEKYTGQNFFAVLGGRSVPVMRDGAARATGPFAHPILAGTVGATFLPIALSLWRVHRLNALLGLSAAAGMVLASTSTGPVMMVVVACIGLLTWKVRNALRFIRYATVVGIIGLDVVMNAPVYFLMARIDITGSSAGWHRAQLIRSAIIHLNEWWIVGTDYTRHWMPSGIPANENHTDMTNHFLAMGVMGGLPLLVIFVLVLWAGFRGVGRELRRSQENTPQQEFLMWTLGVVLFAQAVNFMSIRLFDQSIVFFYLILAAIAALQRPPARLARPKAALERGRAVGTHSVGGYLGEGRRGKRNDAAVRPGRPTSGGGNRRWAMRSSR